MNYLVIALCLYYSPLSIDISKIAGKTPTEVESILGRQTKSELYKLLKESNCQCEKYYYLDGKVSIVYLDGKADWITISSEMKLANLNKVKIRAFHKFHDYYLIQAISMKENQCCLTQTS